MQSPPLCVYRAYLAGEILDNIPHSLTHSPSQTLNFYPILRFTLRFSTFKNKEKGETEIFLQKQTKNFHSFE
jgi:hypothetical protein